ncbi:MAG: hypothetical protein JWM85_1471 [Acidimicrobiaceae bacterium]|nr:hypothetical protein [Acidimicrobiaceae bacterium]
MLSDPLISVVVPVLNGEHHIGECIRSLLAQSYHAFEVVVADNRSGDRTVEIVRSFDDPRIRILPEPPVQLGLHANWARALSGARGDLVKLVCHDDLLLPDCLAVQQALLAAHPDAVLAAGRRRIIDDVGRVVLAARGLGPLLEEEPSRAIGGAELARTCTTSGANLLGEPASVLMRRSALPEPLFDERWHYTIDIEFYLRCVARSWAVVDEQVICCFRVSPGQLSARLASTQARELRDLFSELAQRYPDAISAGDVRRGAVRSHLLTQARRILYQQMRLRAALGRVRALPSASDESAGFRAGVVRSPGDL